MNPNLNFNYLNGASAKKGCGVTFLGDFWYFGDENKVSLIMVVSSLNFGLNVKLSSLKASKVVGCDLVRQTDLAFQFNHGSCNAFNEPVPKVLLCFDEDENRLCHT